jgi:hypothetical protein
MRFILGPCSTEHAVLSLVAIVVVLAVAGVLDAVREYSRPDHRSAHRRPFAVIHHYSNVRKRRIAFC